VRPGHEQKNTIIRGLAPSRLRKTRGEAELVRAFVERPRKTDG
jgi:hypothetical protein